MTDANAPDTPPSSAQDLGNPDVVAKNATTERDLRHVTWLARVLDDWYLDPIIGFVLPGLGDFFCSMMGFYIVLVAVRRNVPRVVVARMLLNLAADAVIGAIPIVGDAYDVMFKANRRNLELLKSRPPAAPPRMSDYLFIAAASTAFTLALFLPLALFFWLVGVAADHL